METDESRYAHRIWKALDAEPSFLGIRGRYVLLFLLMAAAGTAAGACLTATAGNLAGTAAVAAALAAAYLCVLAVQSRLTARQFSRMVSKRRLRQYSRVRPLSVRAVLNDTFTWK